MKFLVNTLHCDINTQIQNFHVIHLAIRANNIEVIDYYIYRSCEFDQFNNLIAYSESKNIYDIKLLKYLMENNIIAEKNDIEIKIMQYKSILHCLVGFSPLLNLSPSLSTKERLKNLKNVLNMHLKEVMTITQFIIL